MDAERSSTVAFADQAKQDKESSGQTSAAAAATADESKGLVTLMLGDYNYGAIENDEGDPDKGLIPGEFLDPLGLFIKTLGVAAPMLGPLCLIVMMNLKNPHELTMQCENHPFPIAIACSTNVQAVKMFPRIGLCLSFLLMAWRMLHERAYYTLLKNKLMINFGTGARFGVWSMIVLTFLFLVACSHLVLKFFYGHPCDEYNQCDPSRFMLKSTFKELVHDPTALKDPANAEAFSFLMLVVMKFVVPAVICLSTLAGLLGIESELMPAAKMFDSEPRQNYRELGDCVFVPEPTFRHILYQCLSLNPDNPADEVVSRPRIVGARGEAVEMPEVCRELYAEAQKAGCFVLGDTTRKTAYQQCATTHHSHGIFEILYIRWWPTKLLVDLTLIDAESVGFKRIIGTHFSITLLLLLALLSVGARRAIQYSMIIFGEADSAKVMLIPLGFLLVEMIFEIQWILQVQSMARHIFAAPGEKSAGSDSEARSSTQTYDPEKAVKAA